MKHFFVLLLLLCPSWATAETFTTVEAYLAYVTNGKPLVSGRVKSSAGEIEFGGGDVQWTMNKLHDLTARLSAGEIIFGAVQWYPPDDATERNFPCLASVFVLEKLKDNGFKEVVHSRPSGGFSESAMEVFDGIEMQSNSRFSVRLHSFKPLGRITYRFALVDQSWHLSGRDESFCFYDKEAEDACSIEVKRSTNILTGKIIENKFRGNSLVSTKNNKIRFPKFPLAEFIFFDEKHGSL